MLYPEPKSMTSSKRLLAASLLVATCVLLVVVGVALGVSENRSAPSRLVVGPRVVIKLEVELREQIVASP